MISQIANKHADKCRFCWMCRHLCPVQLQTGKEINTPRAKGLLLSQIARGTEFDADVAKAMYECFLCDACTNDCATGYEPPLFIREARTEAVVNNLAPKPVFDLIDRIDEKGTIYEGEKAVFDAPEKGDVLVYIGEVASYKVPEMAKALLSLLNKAGVSYMVLKDEPASGATKVVVLDSYDHQIMKQKYGEWGCEIKAEMVSATSFVAELLEYGKLTVKNKAEGTAVYHDDDRAARTFHEFEPARKIAEAIGYNMIEMFNKLKLAKSCGCSVAKAYMPEIVAMTAKGRWDDLLRTEATIMLTSNPESYECFDMAVPEGKQLVDLFAALDGAC